MTEKDTSGQGNIADLMYVDRSLAVACIRGREAVVRRFRKILVKENLSEQQWRVIRILLEMGPKTSVELSTLACIHKVSISRITKSLDERGFTTRTASPSDARASYIALTDLARDRMAPLIAEAKEIHAGIAQDFGEDRYWQLLKLLRELSQIND